MFFDFGITMFAVYSNSSLSVSFCLFKLGEYRRVWMRELCPSSFDTLSIRIPSSTGVLSALVRTFFAGALLEGRIGSDENIAFHQSQILQKPVSGVATQEELDCETFF